jgi:hypothetical protein
MHLPLPVSVLSPKCPRTIIKICMLCVDPPFWKVDLIHGSEKLQGGTSPKVSLGGDICISTDKCPPWPVTCDSECWFIVSETSARGDIQQDWIDII